MERIKLVNIIKSYGDKKLFEIPSLTIQDGQKIGIVGNNGSGKSTLLNIISKEISPDEGEIKVVGKVSHIKQQDDISTNKNSTISGGEKMLKMINSALQENPNILLADEPSSNLDINNVEYVIRQFKNFKGTLLLISHDRNILDNVCDIIIDINNGKLEKYIGNYTSFKSQKEHKLKRSEFEYYQYINQKNKLQNSISVSKNSANSIRKTPKRMGNSEARLHKRESTEIVKKLEGHTKALETRLNQLNEKEKPLPNYSVHFIIPENSIIRSKNILFSDNLSLSINNKVLLENAKLYISTNQKVALIGKNGIGKTSLIKLIINRNKQLSINPQVKIGYFSQDLSNLNEDKSIMENIINDSIQSESTIRNILACLHIKDNNINKVVKNLSGGEKVKVSLTKLLVSDFNFLILDEPTNFLDIEAIEGLEKLLKEYKGSILLVSHDRDIIDNICDNIILFNNKKLIQFNGNYSKYLKEEEIKNSKKAISNNKMLLEFKLTKLDSEIAIEKDLNKKNLLEEERNEILRQLNFDI